MFKTLIAALVLASTTLALAGNASAGPAPTGETSYIDHASKNWDGGGY